MTAVTDEMVERAAIAIVNCERTHISLDPITSLEHVLPMDRPFVLEEARAALAAALSLPVSNTGEWQPIETAPHACHFLATYWSDDFCEWTVSVVMQPLSGPWTHWQPLPEPPK